MNIQMTHLKRIGETSKMVPFGHISGFEVEQKKIIKKSV